MKHEMHVSLWLGNTLSQTEFEKYVEFRHSEENAASAFLKEFGINPDKVDEDYFEYAYLPTATENVAALLMGCSYEREVVMTFRKLLGEKLDTKYNSVILVYDYAHPQDEQKTLIGSRKNSGFGYAGCVTVHCVL